MLLLFAPVFFLNSKKKNPKKQANLAVEFLRRRTARTSRSRERSDLNVESLALHRPFNEPVERRNRRRQERHNLQHMSCIPACDVLRAYPDHRDLPRLLNVEHGSPDITRLVKEHPRVLDAPDHRAIGERLRKGDHAGAVAEVAVQRCRLWPTDENLINPLKCETLEDVFFSSKGCMTRTLWCWWRSCSCGCRCHSYVVFLFLFSFSF